ncbi:leucine-rich repeat-containing protein 38 isoform X2 [Esox lucius]|uniref:leucine-rich repeat-containing protein 38 isoform X2 n=1 Tax=Esox lucius TaxID=8010 RepID=UPI001476F20C|nr:leucine-rich repeat-containing protein 38 isoform X2 [Esox lucius]
MLPCVCWLQPLLVFLSSVWRAQGEHCPASCLCPDAHTVDCSGRGLTRLPDEIPLDVRRLLLSDNWIPRIPSDFLVLYSDLVYLDLRNNSLSHIEPGTLSTSSRLVFLDLGSNNLTEIPSGTFGQSRSLIKLRLSNNPFLSMVNEDAFMGLTSLRELELERNALSGLQVGALSQLPSLRVVRLEGNPWVCNCNFANLFAWLEENSHKLPNAPHQLPQKKKMADSRTFWSQPLHSSLPPGLHQDGYLKAPEEQFWDKKEKKAAAATVLWIQQ